jgi:osmotically-inducible protein OsmY
MFKKCLISLILTTSLVGCGSSIMDESTGEYIDSTAVTTKVKGRLFDMLGQDAFSIKVKTFKDTVQLSGFVDSYQIKQKAGLIADNTVGVQYVKNDLIVKNSHSANSHPMLR